MVGWNIPTHIKKRDPDDFVRCKLDFGWCVERDRFLAISAVSNLNVTGVGYQQVLQVLILLFP